MSATKRPQEGYVKFQVQWTPGPAPAHPELSALDRARTRLHDAGLIGVTPEGIGFGNLSLREGSGDGFLITGTATGASRELGAAGYTRVTDFDVGGNRVACTGPVKASAETMSHGVIYRVNTRVRCVIHVHHRGLWRAALAGVMVRTPREAEYGTPEMAKAIAKLIGTMPEADRGIFVLAGHEDGLIAYGPDVAVPERLLMAALQAAE